MKEFLQSDMVGKIELDKSICVHDYKDFKKTEKGQKMIEKYLDRWSKLGFIEGLDGEIRERCAVAMEQLAVYLITEAVEKELTGPFETIGFPMVRRICCGSIGNQEKLNDLDLFNFEKFIKYSKELNVVGLMEDVDKIVGDTEQFDAEAEACALGCEMIIKKFNGDERSLDEIKVEYLNKIKEKISKRNEGTSSDNTNA
jgi:hypothetical protein